MNNTIYEIIVYEVTDRETAIAARRKSMESAKTYPGFRAYRALSGIEPETMMADLIEWDDHDSAKAAGERVKTDPEFVEIFSAVSDVKLLAHFTSDKLLSSGA
ncbi:antibiotic biosynthesis monooxygenase [Pelagibius sp. Alg239-R121]|uniref:antibiotic biosynthesis monooxygenase family protein n=1 Tax=Pelagibius sp. Alg239-R121 TaxID=2993448 RepID=UPI0024A65D00|nr:hypothetical protein [Pelagibius sp. Alg239-R121]